MSFDPIMLDQLGKGIKPLRTEILEILIAAGRRLCCKDIYSKSTIATDTKTLSVEVHNMKNDGLIEIAEMRKREGFREVAYYGLTEAGFQAVKGDTVADDPVPEASPRPLIIPSVSETVKPMVQKAVANMEKTQMEHEKPKSMARLMLEKLADKRECLNKELLKASGASSVIPFLRNYIDRGLIIKDGLNYRVADGVTREMLLADGRGGNRIVARKDTPREQEGHEGKPAVELGKTSEAAKEEYDIPTFLRRQPDAEIPGNGRFRVARTSDKTLMLFGLSPEPIELNPEQTHLLIAFVMDEGIPCA